MAADQARSKMLGKLSGVFKEPIRSDFTIHCHDRQFHVHQSIISIQSQYFTKACGSTFKEGNERSITLEEDDPFVVQAMLQFLYVGDYLDDERGPYHSAPMVFHSAVFALAEKYLVHELQILANEKFEELADRDYYKPDLIEAIATIYNKHPTSNGLLRESAVRYLSRRTDSKFLGSTIAGENRKAGPLGSASPVDNGANDADISLNQLLDDVPDLGRDLAMLAQRKFAEMVHGCLSTICRNCDDDVGKSLIDLLASSSVASEQFACPTCNLLLGLNNNKHKCSSEDCD